MPATARKSFIVLGAFVALLLTALALVQWTAGRQFERRHDQFLLQKMPAYDQVVQKVMAQKASLTDQSGDLGDIMPRQLTASARTNADGSVTILFPGGEGGPRHGYIYHSGALLTSKPGEPDGYIYHLTNGWYEY